MNIERKIRLVYPTRRALSHAAKAFLEDRWVAAVDCRRASEGYIMARHHKTSHPPASILVASAKGLSPMGQPVTLTTFDFAFLCSTGSYLRS